MNNKALFSSKDISKISKCRLLQFLFGTLRVNSSEKMVLLTQTGNWNTNAINFVT